VSDIKKIIEHVHDGGALKKDEIIRILSLPPDSPEAADIMAESRRLSQQFTGDRAEIHGQFALNRTPCPKNCAFCSFAAANKVFSESMELTVREAVDSALQLEQSGANAVYIMTTDNYDFGKFIEVSAEVRSRLKPETVFIANTGDRTPPEALRMKQAGFDGVYHALRLREGKDTAIDPAKRIASLQAFRDAGLPVGTCVEPIGPEHTNIEIAEMILFTASLKPAYSGAARRIVIPGTGLARHGMISEQRMAQVVAVTRLAMPRTTPGNCTHEPCAVGAAAGASLFWAEIGANPRDTQDKTEQGRGATVQQCRDLFAQAGMQVLHGPSRFYGEHLSE
jgi:biotin synthase